MTQKSLANFENIFKRCKETDTLEREINELNSYLEECVRETTEHRVIKKNNWWTYELSSRKNEIKKLRRR